MLGTYTELRFWRHDQSLTEVPGDLRPIYPERIRLRHYGYRSPEQIRVRLETRREPMLRGEFIHEKRSNWLPGGYAAPGPALPEDLPQSWEERIAPHAECHLDAGVDSLLPPLTWTPPIANPPHSTPLSDLRGKLRSAIGRFWPAHEEDTVDTEF